MSGYPNLIPVGTRVRSFSGHYGVIVGHGVWPARPYVWQADGDDKTVTATIGAFTVDGAS